MGRPHLPVYLVLQARRRTRCTSPHTVVGSYPAFSPLPNPAARTGPAVVFCYGRRRLLPSVLSTAGCPFLSGLSSAPQPRRTAAAADRPTFLRLQRYDILFNLVRFLKTSYETLENLPVRRSPGLFLRECPGQAVPCGGGPVCPARRPRVHAGAFFFMTEPSTSPPDSTGKARSAP